MNAARSLVQRLGALSISGSSFGSSGAIAIARRGVADAADAASSSGSAAFDPALVRFLVCPLSKAPLRLDAARQELVCDELRVAYPIVGGIARLVPAEGRVLGDDEAAGGSASGSGGGASGGGGTAHPPGAAARSGGDGSAS